MTTAFISISTHKSYMYIFFKFGDIFFNTYLSAVRSFHTFRKSPQIKHRASSLAQYCTVSSHQNDAQVTSLSELLRFTCAHSICKYMSLLFAVNCCLLVWKYKMLFPPKADFHVTEHQQSTLVSESSYKVP